MNSNFWVWYKYFFVFIFPLFFSYTGIWGWGPWGSTFSLLVGVVGWIWFVSVLYKKNMTEPSILINEARRLQRSGKLVDAEVTEVISKSKNKDGLEMVEIMASFPNFAGTNVSAHFEFVDSKPHLSRYEAGKKIPLRLNYEKGAKIPWIYDDAELVPNRTIHNRIYLFAIVYSIVVFIVNYKVFSNGWRWLSLFHPWVYTPYWGAYTERTILRFSNKITTESGGDESNELLLYGEEAVGKITKSSQTGKYINEQPEIKFSIRYTDKKGQTHFVEKKEIVLLTDMHNKQVGDVKLLYLPYDPQKIMICVKHG